MIKRLASLNIISAILLPIFLLPIGIQAAVMEEIVVTAQKREQNIQDVGISITAYSGDQLDELGINNPDDLDNMVPGLMVTTFGIPTTTVFTLRGSTQLDFADHQEPPVAVYVDGAYNSYIGGVGQSFYDIDRIEVLKGPQGTLFGRNATGGLTHLLTNQPTQEKEGYVQATVGEFGTQKLEVAMSGGLSDTLSVRLSGLYDKNDGFIESLNGGPDLPEVDSKNLRLQFLYEPNNDFTMHVAARWNKDDSGTATGYHPTSVALSFPALSGAELFTITNGITGLLGLPNDPSIVIPAVGEGDGLVRHVSGQVFADGCAHPLSVGAYVPGGVDCFGTALADADPLTAQLSMPGEYTRDYNSITLTLEWQRGKFEIINIVDYAEIEKYYYEDTDGTPLRSLEFYQDVDSSQFSEEFRVHWEGEDSRFVGGFYYLRIDGDYGSGIFLPEGLGFSIQNEYSNETESWAVFAQGEWDISDEMTFIAGARWTEDEKDATFSPQCEWAIFGDPDCSFLFLPFLGFAGNSVQELGYDLDRSESDWSGILELDYRPNEDWLWFGKVTRGNKAGGFNGGAIAIYTPDQAEFDGEVLTSYEIGFKSTLADGRVRLNASVFYYDYQDFQTYTQFGPSLIVFNTDAEVNGTEIELIANPSEGWEFILGVSHLDAEVNDLFGDGSRTGVPMTNSPELTINGMARYEWPMLDGTMSFMVDFNWVDERALNAIPHPAYSGDDYLLTNASLRFTSGDDRWQADVWVKNLNDEDWITTAFDLSTFNGLGIEIPGHPRWMGASLTYRW